MKWTCKGLFTDGINDKMFTYKKYKSKVLAYSYFVLTSELCIANGPLTSMLEVSSDSAINHTIVVLSKSASPCNFGSGFMVFYHFATTSIQILQNKQNIFSRPSTQNLGIAMHMMHVKVYLSLFSVQLQSAFRDPQPHPLPFSKS